MLASFLNVCVCVATVCLCSSNFAGQCMDYDKGVWP